MKNHMIKQIKKYYHKIFSLLIGTTLLKPAHKKYNNFTFEEWDENANFYK